MLNINSLPQELCYKKSQYCAWRNGLIDTCQHSFELGDIGMPLYYNGVSDNIRTLWDALFMLLPSDAMWCDNSCSSCVQIMAWCQDITWTYAESYQQWHSKKHLHDDVIKWKHFPRYWPFVRWIHQWPVNSLHKGQWRGALMFSLICICINGWVNNREAGDLRRHRVIMKSL